jgi:uroporphyrinogen decarboxylase
MINADTGADTGTVHLSQASVQARLEAAEQRFYAAIRREKHDRTPIMISNGLAMAKYIDASIEPADCLERPFWVADKAIEGLEKMKYIDGVGLLCQLPNPASGAFWMAKVKRPGIELARDEMWQIDEVALMQYEDYDTIINDGWDSFFLSYMQRIGCTEQDFEDSGKALEYGNQLCDQYGYISCPQLLFNSTLDALCSGRGMLEFYTDVMKHPDKVKAVLDVMLEDSLAKYRQAAEVIKPKIVFVQPGVRGNSDFMMPSQFEELLFPHFRAQANLAIEMGAYVYFHMDGNWTSFLDYFTEFPAGKCIFDTDGMTDLNKVREILGDRMAVTGNLGASLMTVGTPDQVYAEARQLVEDFGDSLVMSTACGLPTNVKPENIDAMISACVE